MIYPKFKAEHTVTSPIWNKTEVKVWQFQLNQIAPGENMNIDQNQAELLLDCSLSNIKVWRKSLEASPNETDVTYQSNDLIYKLLDLELKLQQLQNFIEK